MLMIINNVVMITGSMAIQHKWRGSLQIQVRRWSVDTVQSLGQVDWDDYDSLEEVLSWMVAVITFDQFDDPQEEAGVHL